MLYWLTHARDRHNGVGGAAVQPYDLLQAAGVFSLIPRTHQARLCGMWQDAAVDFFVFALFSRPRRYVTQCGQNMD